MRLESGNGKEMPRPTHHPTKMHTTFFVTLQAACGLSRPRSCLMMLHAKMGRQIQDTAASAPVQVPGVDPMISWHSTVDSGTA